MRKIERIFIHCTATSPNATIKNLLDGFKRNGWEYPGYNVIIDRNGKINQVLDNEHPSNGVKGYNQTAINIAYIGGIDETGNAVDNRTEKQKQSLIRLLLALRKKYPQAKILGHRDISPDTNGNGIVDPWERIKECPCFDSITEYKDI